MGEVDTVEVDGDGIDAHVISLYETRWCVEPYYVIF